MPRSEDGNRAVDGENRTEPQVAMSGGLESWSAEPRPRPVSATSASRPKLADDKRSCQRKMARVNKKIQSLERQIEVVKRQVAALGDLQPGSLSEQYSVCGKPNCRCVGSPPQKHGPYYQLSFSRKGKSSSRFVRREDLVAVRRQVRNYTRLRELVDRWIDLATELANLRVAETRK